jgi:hypothetical protein
LARLDNLAGQLDNALLQSGWFSRRPIVAKKQSQEKKKIDSSRILLWGGGVVLALLFLLGVANLLAPRAVQRLLVGSTATPLASPTFAPPKAAIVDQTGFSFPSPEFIAQAQEYLEEAGYVVDVYPPEEVTVDFFTTLPDRGYRLILFQTHATSEVLLEGGGDVSQYEPSPGPFLFTTELYEMHRYIRLQMDDQLRASKLFYEDSPRLFALGPKFVRSSMNGFFLDTVIIIGGCQSLAEPDLAEAFLERGASIVIGWDAMVDLSHNNKTMLHLLQSMTVEGLSPQEAVAAARAEIGADPTYESSLAYLP